MNEKAKGLIVLCSFRLFLMTIPKSSVQTISLMSRLDKLMLFQFHSRPQAMCPAVGHSSARMHLSGLLPPPMASSSRNTSTQDWSLQTETAILSTFLGMLIFLIIKSWKCSCKNRALTHHTFSRGNQRAPVAEGKLASWKKASQWV